MRMQDEAQGRSPLLLYERPVPAPAQLGALPENHYLWPKLGLKGDYFNPGVQASLLNPARTLSPKFPESHRIIASSVWPGALVPTPVSPLPFFPHVPSSGEVEAEAAVRDRCVPCQTWELQHSAGQALPKVTQQEPREH